MRGLATRGLATSLKHPSERNGVFNYNGSNLKHTAYRTFSIEHIEQYVAGKNSDKIKEDKERYPALPRAEI